MWRNIYLLALNPFVGGKSNFIIVTTPNQGVAQARNEGLKIAQGEYVFFMDPDDYINQGMFREVMAKCREGNYDAVHFDYQKTFYALIGQDDVFVFDGKLLLEVANSHIFPMMMAMVLYLWDVLYNASLQKSNNDHMIMWILGTVIDSLEVRNYGG